MFQVRTACFLLLSLWERVRVRVLSIATGSVREADVSIKPGAQAPGSKPPIAIEPAKRAIEVRTGSGSDRITNATHALDLFANDSDTDSAVARFPGFEYFQRHVPGVPLRSQPRLYADTRFAC